MASLLLHSGQPSVTLLKQAADPSIVFSRSYIPGNWDCVIRWGNAGTIQAKGVELNHASALKRLSALAGSEIAMMNGMPFQTVSSSLGVPAESAVCRIHIADMNPISVSAAEEASSGRSPIRLLALKKP